MDSFLALPRYPFTRSAIEHAPEEGGIYGLFEATEFIYIGTTFDSIRACLLRHQDGAHGECTMAATAFAWEATLWPRARAAEVLARYHESQRRAPRCQAKAA